MGNKKVIVLSEYIFQKWHLLNNFVQLPYYVVGMGTMMKIYRDKDSDRRS